MSEPENKVTLDDPDMQNVEPALRRAFMRALALGIKNNTPVYIYVGGEIMDARTLVDIRDPQTWAGNINLSHFLNRSQK